MECADSPPQAAAIVLATVPIDPAPSHTPSPPSLAASAPPLLTAGEGALALTSAHTPSLSLTLHTPPSTPSPLLPIATRTECPTHVCDRCDGVCVCAHVPGDACTAPTEVQSSRSPPPASSESRAPTPLLDAAYGTDVHAQPSVASAQAPQRADSRVLRSASASAAACAAAPLSLSLPLSRASSPVPVTAPSSASGVSASDASSLLATSTSPLSSLLTSASLPPWLLEALRAASGKGARNETLVRQRFNIAAAVALREHCKLDAVAYPVESLIAADGEQMHALGSGLRDALITNLCLTFGFASSPHLSLTSVGKTDAACRVLLRAVCVDGASVVPLLMRMYDAHLPAGCGLPRSSQLLLEAAGNTAPVPADAPTHLPAVMAPRGAVIPLHPPPLLPPAAVVVPRISGVRIDNVSGEGEQCWYRVVGDALKYECIIDKKNGRPRWNKLAAHLRTAVRTITSAPMLCSFGFNIEPTASDAQVKKVKDKYLHSTDFKLQRWGGSLEMFLLSYALEGQTTFITIDQSEEPIKRFDAYGNKSLGKHTLLPARPEGRLPVREVALHHCAYRGSSRRVANHYNSMVYLTGTDECEYQVWPYLQEETDGQRQARTELLLKVARAATADAAKSAKEDEQAEMLLAQWIQDHPTPPASPKHTTNAAAAAAGGSGSTTATESKRRAATRMSMPRAVKFNDKDEAAASTSRMIAEWTVKDGGSDGAKGTATAGGPTRPPQRHHISSRTQSSTSVASTPPTPIASGYIPSSARVNVWRELPKSCYTHFLAVAAPMFEKYAILSAKGEGKRCAEVLHAILDLPAIALRRSGGVHELKQSLEKQMEEYRKLDVTMDVPVEDHPLPLPAVPSTESLSLTAAAAVDVIEPKSKSDGLVDGTVPVSSSDSDSECESQDDIAADCEHTSPLEATHPSDDSPDDEQTRAIKRAVRICHEGGPRSLTRACDALMQDPLAPVNAESIAQLQKLHPDRVGTLTPMPCNRGVDLVSVDPQTLLRLLKRRVHNGSAPGPSGWSGSHLLVIAEHGSVEAKEGLCLLIKDICNGIFGGATRDRLLACILIPVSKGMGRGVRPIAMGEVLVKLATHYIMSLIEDQLPTLFPRIQYGVKRSGGSESAAQLTRAMLQQSLRLHPDSIILKTDFENAFNAISRSLIWSTLLKHAGTEPIWKMFRWAHADASPLLVYDRSRLHSVMQSREGVRQGDPFAAFGFALTVQTMYMRAIADLTKIHGVSILDDLSSIGAQQEVFTSFDRIKAMSSEYHLNLQVSKCEVYVPDSISKESRILIEAACKERGLKIVDSLETLGVKIGKEESVVKHMEAAVRSHERLLSYLSHPAMPVQVGYSLLRSCALPRLGFLARTVHPSLFIPAARRFDSMILDCFHRIMQIPPDVGKLQKDLPTEQLQRLLTLPIKAGGMGLRPMERVSHSAYFASLAAVLPDFIQAFPRSVCSDYTQTSVHAELQECRQHMESQGVTYGKRKAATQPHTGRGRMPSGIVHVPPPMPCSYTPSSSQMDSDPSVLTLQGSVAAVWKHAESHVTERVKVPFLSSEKLQHSATFLIEERIYKQLHVDSSPRRRALLTALTAKHASAYLTVLPSQHCYRMSDASMRMGVRHRLGVLPFATLAAQRCHCSQHSEFASDPDHFHSCVFFKRTLLTLRHDAIAQVVSDLARSCGFFVQREPNAHIRPESTRDLPPASAGYNIHADLLLLKHDRKLYIDIAISRPTNEFMHAMRSVQQVPLVTTVVREKEKARKYSAIAEENGYTLTAFAMETYGGIGKEAEKLLHVLASHSTEYDPKEFLTHAHRRLSVTLQSANASIALMGMQQYHLHQRTVNTNQQRLKPRTFGYVQALNNDRLHRQVQPILEREAAATAEAEADASGIEIACTFDHSTRVCSADAEGRVRVEVEVTPNDPFDFTVEVPVAA